MKVSKTLAFLVAATAVAGSIGFAYAQTTDTTTPPAAAPETSMQNQGTTSPSGMTAPAATDPALQPERPARADRN